MLPAFANIYADLAEEISRRLAGGEPSQAGLMYPTGQEGLHTLAAVHAAAESARNGGSWVNVPQYAGGARQ